MKHLEHIAIAIVLALSLPSCGNAPPHEETRARPQADAPPAAPKPAAPSAALQPLDAGNAAPSSSRRPFAEIFRGSGSFVAQPAHHTASVDASGDLSLNFVNADARDVAKAVLGDLLKLNYVIDPGVQGTVTVQTSEPVTRAALLPALESAFRLSNIAIVKSGDLYQVVPLANAPRESGLVDLERRRLAAQGGGFGVTIVPLRYITAQEMQRLLEPLVPSGSVQQVDAARNLLVIAGTQPDLATMLDDIALFDVDWLSGMSFAFLSPESIDANTLVKELNEIIGGRDNPMAGLVRLIPITHQNKVLAISPQARYLDELAKWAERLDQPSEVAEQRLYVYRVQHGSAPDLAAVLMRLLTGSGGAESNAGAIRPGGIGQTIIGKPSAGQGYGTTAPGPTPAPGLFGSGMTSSPSQPGGARAVPAAATAALPLPPPLPLPAPTDGSDFAPGTRPGSTARITADENNNLLLIMATPRDYATIGTALRELDAMPPQVLLEAAIAEVTLTKDLQFGVQYFFQKGNNQAVLTNTVAAITPSFPGLAYSFASGANINVILSAIESVTHVDVLSAPEVLVLNNQTASLQVGDQVPIATEQAVNVITTGGPVLNTIQYRDTGVTLKVTPRINQGGLVLMDIDQEVSDVAATTSSTLNSPTINERKISSTVAVHDGETIALGGLISDNRTTTKSGIPVLQDIPVLGSLFSTTDNQLSRTELLVLITPHVIQSTEDARAVTQELRQKVPLARSVLPRGE